MESSVMNYSVFGYNGVTCTSTGMGNCTNFSLIEIDHIEDYSDIPYEGKIKVAPLWQVIIKSLIFGIIIFFSLIGNALIIAIVLRNKKMRTATNYYIVNLAVADLMVTICCTWVTLVDDVTEGWVLGGFFCKFNTFTQVLSLVASVLSLTLIAYDRFFGIVFALRAHMTEKRASISLIVIWIFSILVALPILVMRQMKVRQWKDHTEIWCDGEWPVDVDYVGDQKKYSMPLRSVYFVSVSVVLYFIPMVIMTIAYGVIIIKLWVSTIPGEKVDTHVEQQAKTRKRIIMMLVALLIVFAVCWLPCQVMLLYSELRNNRITFGDWYYDLQFAAYSMAYANSALNPLIYAGFNEKFKRGLISIWRRVTFRKEVRDIHHKSYGTNYTHHTVDTCV